MKTKVLVEIIIPAAEKKFDVFIPLMNRMSDVKLLISGVVNELSGGKIKTDPSSILCDAENGNILDINKRVTELGIKNGSKLLFI